MKGIVTCDVIDVMPDGRKHKRTFSFVKGPRFVTLEAAYPIIQSYIDGTNNLNSVLILAKKIENWA